MKPTMNHWADAIATRIADEWSGKPDNPDDAVLLEKVLKKALRSAPEYTRQLIGTSVIEEDYFE